MLEKETDCFYDERCGSNRKLKGVFSRQLFESYFIRSAVLARPHPKKKWKIITLVREPIARNISALFHDLDEYIPGSHNNIYSIPYEELFQAFLEKVNHELPLTWFDIELNPLFGVDVYASPFPKEKGYQTYSSERADVLLIRMEDLTRVFSKAMSEFLGIENTELVFENQAKDKAYFRLYQMFRERVTLPGDYIEKMYCSKFARHFYSEVEIQTFTSKWLCGCSLKY
jgi:hypothetical protein